MKPSELREKLERMTVGPWASDFTQGGPEVRKVARNAKGGVDLIAPYISGNDNADGIATLRNVAPLLVELWDACHELATRMAMNREEQTPYEAKLVDDAMKALAALEAHRG